MENATTWQSVRAEALRRIRTREWPPGSQIPHEADLAAEFGCARATMNRALRDLAEAGLLDRRRKGGTRVPLMPVRKATFDISIIRHDVEGRGQTHGYKLLSDTHDFPPDPIRLALKLANPVKMRAVQALHLADGAPFCLERRWINPAFVAEEIGFDVVSANEWLVQNVSYSSGDFSFYATHADDALAAVLKCPKGAPLFGIDRTTFLEQQPITAVTLIYAPGYRMITKV
jgi:GntR family histidine utilization transcriptional repressor